MENVTRRNFITGTAMAGVAAAATGIAHADEAVA